MTTRVIFVRHGETQHNVDMVITSGSPGAALTERGREQVASVASELRAWQPSAIFSSPLLRARESAEILSLALGLEVTFVDALRECSVGELEGRSGPEDFARFDLTFERWYHEGDLGFTLGPGGESAAAATARILGVFTAIELECLDQTVLVVGHQTVMQIAVTLMSDNLDLASGYQRWVPNAGTMKLDVEGGSVSCRQWAGEDVPG